MSEERKHSTPWSQAWTRLLRGGASDARKDEALRGTLLHALHASQNHLPGAKELWKKGVGQESSSRVRRAFNAPCEGHKSLIEAALLTRDWTSLQCLGQHLPYGYYADGRVAITRAWLGERRGAWAHGVVAGLSEFSTWTFAGSCYEGWPDGPCVYRNPDHDAELSVQCERGIRVGTSTYRHYDETRVLNARRQALSGTLQLPGAWWTKDTKAIAPDVECLWTLPEGKRSAIREFRGRATGEALSDFPFTVRFRALHGTVRFCDGGVFTGDVNLKYQTCVEATGTWSRPRPKNKFAPSEADDADSKEERITGTWYEGRIKAGRGCVYLPAKGLYDGGLNHRELPHGTGSLTWANGAHYEGQWQDGHLQGDGVLSWPDGKRIAGYFYKHGVGLYMSMGNPCDVATGDGRGARFAFNAHGDPDSRTIILLGMSER